MPKMLTTALMTVLSLSTIVLANPAGAEEPLVVAENLFDVFVDNSGRRVYVDPYTGEVVRVVEGNLRSKRTQAQREWRQRQREVRRERRRARLQRELDSLFTERETRRSFDSDRTYDRSNNNGKFRDTIRSKPLPAPDTRVARLPDDTDRVERETAPETPSWLKKKPNMSRDTIVKLQVFLDREGFSPGSIDGAWGSNLSKAVTAWQEAKGSNADLTNPLVLDKYINKPNFNAFTSYTITNSDVSQYFADSIPVDYAEKARLKRLAYTSPIEMLAERFHMSENYLRTLNPNANFYEAGQRIQVVAPGKAAKRKVHYVVADKAREQLRAYDRNGKIVSAYPATIGSASTPSPSGDVEVSRIAFDPNYTYNPKKNFQQGSNDKILTIPPGPNGPVGSIWIALSKPTYGIHGTPNPDKIGKTNSHGCIRLTNWDATELAGLLSKGVTVSFQE